MKWWNPKYSTYVMSHLMCNWMHTVIKILLVQLRCFLLVLQFVRGNTHSFCCDVTMSENYMSTASLICYSLMFLSDRYIFALNLLPQLWFLWLKLIWKQGIMCPLTCWCGWWIQRDQRWGDPRRSSDCSQLRDVMAELFCNRPGAMDDGELPNAVCERGRWRTSWRSVRASGFQDSSWYKVKLRLVGHDHHGQLWVFEPSIKLESFI